MRRATETKAARPLKSQGRLPWSFLVIGLTLFVLLAIFISSTVRGANHSQQRHAMPFSDSIATATLQDYYKAQATALNIMPGTGQIDKWCYQNQINHMGIGGYTENDLWCGVSVTQTISTLPSTENIDTLVNGLQTTAKREGLLTWYYNATPSYPDRSISYGSNDNYSQTSGGYGCSVSAVSDYMPYNTQGDYYLEFVNSPSSPDYAPNSVPAHMRYEMQCDGAAARIPAGYTYLK